MTLEEWRSENEEALMRDCLPPEYIIALDRWWRRQKHLCVAISASLAILDIDMHRYDEYLPIGPSLTWYFHPLAFDAAEMESVN